MKNIRIVIMALMALTTAYVAGSIAHGSVDEIRENKESYAAADKMINVAYNILLNIYPKEYSDARTHLIKAEAAWIKYRDANVEAELAIYNKTALRYVYLEDETQERYQCLKNMIGIIASGNSYIGGHVCGTQNVNCMDAAKNALVILDKMEHPDVMKKPDKAGDSVPSKH
jgi:uncharacterized protein YecT (DUF1311 family)